MINITSDYALLTDFYQLTMANGYLLKGIAEKQAVFDLFFRKAPFNGSYAICYGINMALKGITNMKFSSEDIEYLQERNIFSDEFLDYLANWKCHLTIHSVADGRVIFPREPIMEIEGPLIECQLIETYLLNCFNFPTLCATKANRMWITSGKQPIIEFGLRRAQGSNGGLIASKAAVVGGCEGTSNVLAGKYYGLNVSGTQAHSWVMAFDSELESFRAFADIYPESCILLVDTYDTLESGVPNAIIVGKELQAKGITLRGIRLDSGDITQLSRKAREMLDKAGLKDTKIIASNDIDEYVIEEIQKKNGKVDLWGIGTKLVTCYDQPALGGVYKLVAIDNKPKLKIAETIDKTTLPSKKQVFRIYNDANFMIGDIIELSTIKSLQKEQIYDPINPKKSSKLPKYSSVESLLNLIIEKGKFKGTLKNWHAAKQQMKEDVARLPIKLTQLRHPQKYVVSISRSLHDLRMKLIKQYT
ncbi:MAG: nicotinate phosphoribosyltransferase [Promethearchaeota archaeon]